METNVRCAAGAYADRQAETRSVATRPAIAAQDMANPPVRVAENGGDSLQGDRRRSSEIGLRFEAAKKTAPEGAVVAVRDGICPMPARAGSMRPRLHRTDALAMSARTGDYR